jgi:hypothetical protein
MQIIRIKTCKKSKLKNEGHELRIINQEYKGGIRKGKEKV